MTTRTIFRISEQADLCRNLGNPAIFGHSSILVSLCHETRCLIFWSNYQVVIGSFVPGNQHDQKSKKQKNESIPATLAPNPATVDLPASNAEKEDGIGVQHSQQNSNTLKQNFATASFRTDNWANIEEPRNSDTDINISLPAV